MKAGKLDQRVTFQVLTEAQDSYGDMVATWATSYTDWAEALTKGGGEFYAAQKMSAETNVVFRVRYKSTLDVTGAAKIYRAVWQSRTYEILNINSVNGQKRELLISCKEVV